MLADGKENGIVEFITFGEGWACADSIIIIPSLDQVADVQRQVRCEVESRAAGERGVSARR